MNKLFAGFGTEAYRLPRELKEAVLVNGDIDLNITDKIISHPFYKKHLLNTPETRETEQNILAYMVSFAKPVLDRLYENNNPSDLDIINNLVSKKSWKSLNSKDKDALEFQFNQYLNKILKELTNKGVNSTVFRAYQLVANNMELPELQDKISKGIKLCRARQRDSNKRIKQKLVGVKRLVSHGCFTMAGELLSFLQMDAPENKKVLRVISEYKIRKKGFNNAVNKSKKLIIKKQFDLSMQMIFDLEKQYSSKMDNLPEIKELLKKESLKYYLQESAKIKGGIKAQCGYFEKIMETHDYFFSWYDMQKDGNVCNLYHQYCNVLKDELYTLLESLNIDLYKKTVSLWNNYTKLGLMPKDNLITKMEPYLNRYFKAVHNHDLEKAVDSLCAINDILGNCFNEDSVISQKIVKLSNKAKNWNDIIAYDVGTADENAVKKHINKNLINIINNDNKSFGNRAKDVACKMLMRVKRAAEGRHDLQCVIRCLERMHQLSIGTDMAKTFVSDLAKFRKKLNKECNVLVQARILYKEKKLNKALVVLEPILINSSVQIEAQKSEKEIKNTISIVEQKVNSAWKKINPVANFTSEQLSCSLYQLPLSDLKELYQTLKQGQQEHKDSNVFAEKKAVLKKEFLLRQEVIRLKKMEQAVQNIFKNTVFIADYYRIVQEAENILKIHPDYPPVKDIIIKYQNIIRKKIIELFLKYCHKDCRKYNAALELISEWKQYFGAEKIPLTMKKIVGKVVKDFADADEQFEIAHNFWIELKYEKAEQYVENSLNICSDHIKAIGLKNKLKQRVTGLDLLKKVDTLLKDYTEGKDVDLKKAQDYFHQINAIPLVFRDLKAPEYSLTSAERYMQAIENLSGLPNCVYLSIVPNNNYLLFLSDEIIIGSIEDQGADLKIRANGIKRNHARIIRDKNKTFFVRKNGVCYINDNFLVANNKTSLKAGDKISLNIFKFYVAVVNEGTLVLEITDMDLPDTSLRGIIMLNHNLYITSEGKNSHLYVPGISSSVTIKCDQKKLASGKFSPRELAPRELTIAYGDKKIQMPIGKTCEVGETIISIMRAEI